MLLEYMLTACLLISPKVSNNNKAKVRNSETGLTTATWDNALGGGGGGHILQEHAIFVNKNVK
jgi:hypothetical protein